EQADKGGRGTGRGEHPDVALELDTFLVAALVVELEELITIKSLRGSDQGVIDTLGGVGARLGGLECFVELALTKLGNQRVRQFGGFGRYAPQLPYAFKNDRETNNGNEQQWVGGVVALLDHAQNTELTLHLFPLSCE